MKSFGFAACCFALHRLHLRELNGCLCAGCGKRRHLRLNLRLQFACAFHVGRTVDFAHEPLHFRENLRSHVVDFLKTRHVLGRYGLFVAAAFECGAVPLCAPGFEIHAFVDRAASRGESTEAVRKSTVEVFLQRLGHQANPVLRMVQHAETAAAGHGVVR